MLKSYFTTAIRNLTRNRTYASINILGLAIGVACCFLILLRVHNELSYDRFHEKHDRIFRLYEKHLRSNGSFWTRSITGAAPAPRLQQDYPEIEKVVRYMQLKTLVTVGEKNIYEDGVAYVDGDLFDVFSFSLTRGDPQTALREPYSVVLTGSMARKYFGDSDPLGKTLVLDNSSSMTVTGVLEPVPKNSHLKCEILASFETFAASSRSLDNHWDCPARTFVLVHDASDAAELESKLEAFIGKYRDEEIAAGLKYGLQPLDDVHLNPTVVDPDETTSASRLLMFGAIAVLILLIAIMNFVNLSTAQYAKRVGEVSVRKVLAPVAVN